MISEAALTGKPIYVAMIPAMKSDKRFKKFRGLFENLNIIRELNDKLETWTYEKLDETNRIANEIKKKIK
jgi:mitochondrial fission protein ELM1